LAVVIPAFAPAAGQTISPAPLAGAERHISGTELRRLAQKLGLTQSDAAEWPLSVCFAYTLTPLKREQVVAAIRTAAGSDVAFEVTEHSLFPMPEGDLIFSNVNFRPDRRDGTRLLTGAVVYAPGRQTPAWARVRPLSKPRGLRAVADLRPGVHLEASQVEMADLEATTGMNITALADIEGLTPRRRIAAGTPLTRQMLMRIPDVGPGETVLVRVKAGAAHLSFESRAETGGSAGDQILLKNPTSGQRFRAKVEGRSRASVDVMKEEK
jgi:flagella basal body P-ring formation protein FlgA